MQVYHDTRTACVVELCFGVKGSGLTCSVPGCASAHVQAGQLQQQAAHSEASPQTGSPLPWPSPTACKAFALVLLHMLAESALAGGSAVCLCTFLVPKESKCETSGDFVPYAFGAKGKQVREKWKFCSISWSLTASLDMTLI